MVFYEHLCRYDVASIFVAVNEAIRKSRFFPSIAELIEAIPPPPTSGQKLLELGPPSKEEAKAVLAQLRPYIAECERRDAEREQKRIAERKEFLRKQAEVIDGRNAKARGRIPEA
jgi:hypothetical protein